MQRLRSLSRGGRLLVALAVGGAIFGIASAVQADIPDNGVIHGCYGKAGTPYKGNLRVRDASQGEQCRIYENALDWNQTGPSGATGPTGPTGPSGASGLSIINTGDVGLTAGSYSSAFTCPAGKIAIGGGASDDTNFANLKIDGGVNAGSRASNTPNNQWVIYITLTTPGTDQIDGQQVCVNPPVGNSAPVGPPVVATGSKWIKIK